MTIVIWSDGNTRGVGTQLELLECSLEECRLYGSAGGRSRQVCDAYVDMGELLMLLWLLALVVFLLFVVVIVLLKKT